MRIASAADVICRAFFVPNVHPDKHISPGQVSFALGFKIYSMKQCVMCADKKAPPVSYLPVTVNENAIVQRFAL